MLLKQGHEDSGISHVAIQGEGLVREKALKWEQGWLWVKQQGGMVAGARWRRRRESQRGNRIKWVRGIIRPKYKEPCNHSENISLLMIWGP